MDYLSKGEKEKLIVFNEDDVMKEAVRKVLLAGIYYTGVLNKKDASTDKNWAYNLGGLNDMAMDDAKVGNLLKITTRALAVVEDAFTRLSEFSKDVPQKEEGNPAV